MAGSSACRVASSLGSSTCCADARAHPATITTKANTARRSRLVLLLTAFLDGAKFREIMPRPTPMHTASRRPARPAHAARAQASADRPTCGPAPSAEDRRDHRGLMGPIRWSEGLPEHHGLRRPPRPMAASRTLGRPLQPSVGERMHRPGGSWVRRRSCPSMEPTRRERPAATMRRCRRRRPGQSRQRRRPGPSPGCSALWWRWSLAPASRPPRLPPCGSSCVTNSWITASSIRPPSCAFRAPARRAAERPQRSRDLPFRSRRSVGSPLPLLGDGSRLPPDVARPRRRSRW